ncbi:unnamed protein product [Brugia timori]|uniref:Uncharacterized protein n=1 Tax=Brugia timori TaxID=42155 RepID=A0A0R3QQC0_9BILA|nr:unnamed protein product [Brugia timori]
MSPLEVSPRRRTNFAAVDDISDAISDCRCEFIEVIDKLIPASNLSYNIEKKKNEENFQLQSSFCITEIKQKNILRG